MNSTRYGCKLLRKQQFQPQIFEVSTHTKPPTPATPEIFTSAGKLILSKLWKVMELGKNQNHTTKQDQPTLKAVSPRDRFQCCCRKWHLNCTRRHGRRQRETRFPPSQRERSTERQWQTKKRKRTRKQSSSQTRVKWGGKSPFFVLLVELPTPPWRPKKHDAKGKIETKQKQRFLFENPNDTLLLSLCFDPWQNHKNERWI